MLFKEVELWHWLIDWLEFNAIVKLNRNYHYTYRVFTIIDSELIAIEMVASSVF